MPWSLIAKIVVGGAAVWILLLIVIRVISKTPAGLGVRDGRLASCPASPNCVCTDASDAEHAIAPLTFTGSPADAMTRLKEVLAELPRVTIVAERDDYLRVEFRTLALRYVDDVEFLIDEPAHQIRFRSASRLGWSDLGVNRRRMEEIRRLFEAKAE